MTPSKNALVKQMWLRKNISYKLHSIQKDMLKIYNDAEPNSTMVWLLARQTGKTYFLCWAAVQECIKGPSRIVDYLCDTKVHAREIVEPIMDIVLEDCPPSMRPTFEKARNVYTFPNKSTIKLAGSDGGSYERLRGPMAHLCLVDEAGFCTNLRKIVKSVLIPKTTHTGGKIILASTPSEDPDHEFVQFIEKAELNNSLVKKTIYDNPRLTKEQINHIIKEMGGVDSDEFQREYLCEVVRDPTTLVFPEFTEELQERVVIDHPRPKYYDSYVGMDLGFKDLSAVIFGYYDFLQDKVIIEDEIVIAGKDMILPDFTTSIMETEEKLWTDPISREFKPPYLRVSDIDYLVTTEISRLSNFKLHFSTPRKYDNDAAVNDLRTYLANGKIIIHPRCVTLIRHLRNVRWDKRKSVKGFARSADDGHYDCVDALKYMIRSMDFRKNPYPAGYDLNLRSSDAYFYSDPEQLGYQKPTEMYKKIFGIKTKN